MSAVSKAMYMPLSDRHQCRRWPAGGQDLHRDLAAGQPVGPRAAGSEGSRPLRREAIAAAAVQGLVFGLVRAAVSRASAHGYRAVTHESPE